MKKKKISKNLLSAYILSLILPFMLVIYEPICLYATNGMEFRFTFQQFMKINLGLFLGMSVVFMLLATLVYFITKKLTKKDDLFNVLVILGYVGFAYLYIHGNYFVKGLPNLDGGIIVWQNYTKRAVVSLIILGLLMLPTIIYIVKKTSAKVLKTYTYIGLAIVAMLTTALIPYLCDKEMYKDKVYYYTSTADLNNYSKDKNFIIFLVDAVDSIDFQNQVEKNKDLKENLKDFTYFKDTMSAYPFTRDSIPYIFNGEWNENKTDFIEFDNRSFENSKLLKRLGKEDYDLNLYEEDLFWNTEGVNKIKNSHKHTKLNTKEVIKEEYRYVSFKYLPYYLKKYSQANIMSFNDVLVYEYDPFTWENMNFMNLTDEGAKQVKDKQFKFIHLEGGHVPFYHDENFQPKENATYEEKLLALTKLINGYIEYLKKADVYDNSVIVLLADHGYAGDEVLGRQNPCLYIKGFDEHHHKMKTSDKKIMYEDLPAAYQDLLDEKTSREIFDDIPEERDRRYIFYHYTQEDHMVEYVQKGHAWEEETLKPTGREFNR